MGRIHVRTERRWLLAALCAAAAACGESGPTDPVNGGGNGGGGGGTTRVATTAVTVRNNEFEPQHIKVVPGATVTWTWAAGSVDHNVTFSAAGITDSPDQNTGTFATAMPSTAGTYQYACTFHASMTGSVLVE